MPPGRPPAAREGALLKTAARGFPCFYQRRRLQRVITGDIWAFLRHRSVQTLAKDQERQALAYLEQAYDFYTAATNPRLASRPLLYYYAFLNLGKVLLLHRQVRLAPAANHGIIDPRANSRTRRRLEGQVVTVSGPSHDHSAVMPELIQVLGDGVGFRHGGSYQVVELLAQAPAVHRTFCATTDMPPRFCPVRSIVVLKEGPAIWSRLVLARHDRDVHLSWHRIARRQAFRDCFYRVSSECDDELWFETDEEAFAGRGIETAIGRLARRLRRCGMWVIAGANGYSHYLCDVAPRNRLPQLCSAYAVMFYLGSITRYKPYDFDYAVQKYAWLVSEFLDTQPVQLLHLLASCLARTEVVAPHARGILR